MTQLDFSTRSAASQRSPVLVTFRKASLAERGEHCGRGTARGREEVTQQPGGVGAAETEKG